MINLREFTDDDYEAFSAEPPGQSQRPMIGEVDNGTNQMLFIVNSAGLSALLNEEGQEGDPYTAELHLEVSFEMGKRVATLLLNSSVEIDAGLLLAIGFRQL